VVLASRLPPVPSLTSLPSLPSLPSWPYAWHGYMRHKPWLGSLYQLRTPLAV